MKAEKNFDCVWEYSERHGMRKWLSVRAIEAMAPVTAWPRLGTVSNDQSASEAAPMILET
jgi:hypothetical protein